MKERYRSFYPLPDYEEQQLWEHASVVLDTNVLLNLYGQSPATRKTFVTALEAVSDRLWMPHQVGLEFHANRERTRNDATLTHREVSKNLSVALGKAREQAQALAIRDHLLKTDGVFDRLEKASDALKKALDKSKERFNADRKESGDPVLELVERLYPDDRIGEPFGPKALSRHRRRAAERFAAKQPPGWADANNKTGDRVFGDYFLWVQTMRHARSADVDVVLVSEDRNKGDWIGSDGKPLPALRSEFHQRTGREVSIVDTRTFLEEVSSRITNADAAEVESAAEEIEGAVTALRLMGEYSAAAARDSWVGKSVLGDLGTASFFANLFADVSPMVVPPNLIGRINSQLATGWGDLYIPPQTAMAKYLQTTTAADLIAGLTENRRLMLAELAARQSETSPLAGRSNASDEADGNGETCESEESGGA